jgi:hypothetical protein
MREPECAQAIVDRVEELLWILDHQDDIDADFLAIYGLDLEQDEISSRRYFSLVYRLTAYTGVMAARVEEEREDRQSTGTTTTRTRSEAPPVRQGDGAVKEVSLTAFRVMFPGIVSGGSAGGG